MKTIVALPGEGIGIEVVAATCEVLMGAGIPVKILTPPHGPAAIAVHGSPLPEETKRACREADAVLFGAAGPSTSPGVGWPRWEQEAWAGVRPARFYPGMRSPLADPEGIDFVVVRENSEGMYPGREGDLAGAHLDPRNVLRQAQDPLREAQEEPTVRPLDGPLRDRRHLIERHVLLPPDHLGLDRLPAVSVQHLHGGRKGLPTRDEEERQAELLRQIRDSGLPLHVIVLEPSPSDGPVAESYKRLEREGADFLEAVREEMSQPEGHFVLHVHQFVLGADHTSSSGGDVSVNRAGLAAATVRNEERTCANKMLNVRTGQLERAVEVAVSSDPAAQFERSRQDPLFVGRVCDTGEGSGVGWYLALSFLGLLVMVPMLVAVSLASRRRKARIRRPSPREVVANASRALVRDLRAKAGKRLTAIGHTIAEVRADTEVPASLKALERALDAQEAARRLHDSGEEGGLAVADAVGVQVLLDLAEHETETARALTAGDGPPAPLRHCYVNPMHGTDTTRHVWSDHGPYRLGAPPVPVPLCGDCAAKLEGGGQPEALLVRFEDQAHPYYHLPATECVWSGTGYGAFTEDLVETVRHQARG